MSAASSQLYYQTLCELTQAKYGGLHSPELLLRSVNFADMAEAMAADQWEKIGKILNKEALLLQKGGAAFLLLATNTMHKLADNMMDSVDIPLLHIADATADALMRDARKTPAFLATKFTMEERFYLDRLEARGIHPIVPNATQRHETNEIIFQELCRNIVTPESTQKYVQIVEHLAEQGADSVVLGCTEICMLLNAKNSPLPIYDTTYLHCAAALRKATSM